MGFQISNENLISLNHHSALTSLAGSGEATLLRSGGISRRHLNIGDQGYAVDPNTFELLELSQNFISFLTSQTMKLTLMIECKIDTSQDMSSLLLDSEAAQLLDETTETALA